MEDHNNISQELLEIIERYLNGSLTIQELKDFNQLLELDNDFKLKVEAIKAKHEKTTLKRHSLEPEKKQQNKARLLNYKKITLGIAITIAISSIWFFNTPQNEKLYNKFFKPAPALQNIKNDASNFNDGMSNYKNGNYKTAINKWKVLQENKSKNDSLNYFLGVAYLASKNTIEAIPFLERAIEANDSFAFIDESYLYLGLAYLKEGNIKLAKKYLNSSETDTAKIIINELEN
ncbi:tetratricopeptide repeat protein [Algibacter sp. PT7-4]|uniref:tetratricopeptide repeat protein n=1 Tax=Algibacter ulvanivorans TaxID=3400999 RepID=UPI003AAE2419